MTHDDDRIPEGLRTAARDYNKPPELKGADLDDMWSAIEAEAFVRPFATPSADARSVGTRALTLRNLLPLAAVLLLGVAIGRVSSPRATEVAAPPVAMRPDSIAMPDPYQATASRYLGQAAALLIALPSEVRAGDASEPYKGRAHDLLLTTRLLLDSPAAADPRFRTLLEDLELVLAQVVRLQSAESNAELELIRQALEQRDVLPRLRNAAADISADD
jgi:hypothetical protein